MPTILSARRESRGSAIFFDERSKSNSPEAHIHMVLNNGLSPRGSSMLTLVVGMLLGAAATLALRPGVMVADEPVFSGFPTTDVREHMHIYIIEHMHISCATALPSRARRCTPPMTDVYQISQPLTLVLLHRCMVHAHTLPLPPYVYNSPHFRSSPHSKRAWRKWTSPSSTCSTACTRQR
jgi:hypothetical protein